MNRPPAIETEGLSHTYDRWGHHTRALNDVTLNVAPGEWVNIVGPNGSGKSTLLRVLAGQLTAQEGCVRVAGCDLSMTAPSYATRATFLVQQDPTAGTAPALTVGEHLMLASGSSVKERNSPRQADELVRSFRLGASLDQPASTLSGGQRQLLVLLMAGMREAPVVLLDEPLAALDPDRAGLCDHALDVLHAGGKTLVLVTHDIEYALSRGNRTVGLVAGSVVFDERGARRTREHLGEGWRTASVLV